MTAKFQTVTTRKPHKCHGCRKIIPTGTTIERQTVFAGNDGVYSLYTCRACEVISLYYDAYPDGYPEGFVLGMMDDDEFKGSAEEYLAHLRRNAAPIMQIHY